MLLEAGDCNQKQNELFEKAESQFTLWGIGISCNATGVVETPFSLIGIPAYK